MKFLDYRRADSAGGHACW